MNKKNLTIATGLIIVAAFIGAAIFQTEQPSQDNDNTIDTLTMPERKNAPSKGPNDAKVTIVEFFDPACETCAIFHPFVNSLIEQHPGKLKVVMRYAPFHRGSNDVVKFLEAAHLQGQFWPALEILFANQQRWTRHHVADPQSAVALLTSLTLDSEQFIRDVNSDHTSATITQDITDGKLLKVAATPQFFVNGKPLTDFGYKQLARLVEEAVSEAY